MKTSENKAFMDKLPAQAEKRHTLIVVGQDYFFSKIIVIGM